MSGELMGRVLTTSRYNPNFDQWEDTELAELEKVLAWIVKNTPVEIRAAVVPLLDLEAAALMVWRHDQDEYDFPFEEVRAGCLKQAKAVVYAALGLGEPTSQGGDR